MSSNKFKTKQITLLIVCIILLTTLFVIGMLNINPAWLKILITSILAVLLCVLFSIKVFIPESKTKTKEK